jgi:hypothetical protein
MLTTKLRNLPAGLAALWLSRSSLPRSSSSLQVKPPANRSSKMMQRDVRLTEAGRSFRREKLDADHQSELSR